MSAEIYREIVYVDDPEIITLARRLVIELTQEIKDQEIEQRVLTVEAIRGYLQIVADKNDGMIPVDVMNGIFDDSLAGIK